MIVGVPKEIKLQEHRIGLTPESVKNLTSIGHDVLIEKNGGFEKKFPPNPPVIKRVIWPLKQVFLR